MTTDEETTKACASIPCPPWDEIPLVWDDTFVPTLEDVRQAGCAYAGPEGRVYVERNGRVVLLPVDEV